MVNKWTLFAVCWSPKGKQLVAGRSDGKLVQYDQEAKEKNTHNGPDYFTEPMRSEYLFDQPIRGKAHIIPPMWCQRRFHSANEELV